MADLAVQPTPPWVVARLRSSGCVFAEDEARSLVDAARTRGELAAMVERRADGEPIERVIGWAEFCGLRVGVDHGVFIPRRRSEFLVRQAVSRSRREAVVVDLCCGSGAIGLAVASAVGHIELHAVDIDAAAVSCARRNLGELGGRVYAGDLFDPLPSSLRRRVDVLLANAPYVPTDAIELLPREARMHEPLIALDGGPDGLVIQRRIIAEAPRWLAPGAHLLIETSERQAPRIIEAVSAAGMTASVHTSSRMDATVVVGSPSSRLA